MPTRREVLLAAAGAALGFAAARGRARLGARPGIPLESVTPGELKLRLAPVRDGILYVPPGYSPAVPTPLLLALHGAGGSAQGPMARLRPLADSRGFLLLAVESRGETWDAVRSAFGPDVQFIDRALRFVFERCVVDPARIAIEGFSDGASYALGLGLPNGDLFHRILAFSPGMIPASDDPDRGNPPIFLSHGTRDEVLAIDRTSRVLVRGLRADGYTVRYAEFDGPHTVPPGVLDEAMEWWLGRA